MRGDGPQGPTGALGPTGVAPGYVITDAPEGRPGSRLGATGAADLTSFLMCDGKWYAFRLRRLVDDENARARRVRERMAEGLPIDRYPGQPLRDGLRFDDALAGEDVMEFFGRVRHDHATGFLEIEEIPDPYVCAVCGKSYQDGAHTEFGFDGLGAHGYQMRGAPG